MCGHKPLTDEEQQLLNSDHELYVKQYELSCKSEAETSKHLDHWLLTLSGSSLGLSFTFLDKISSHPQPWTTWFLMLSWILLLLAIVFTLYAHWKSQKAQQRHRDILEYEIRHWRDEIPDKEKENHDAVLTDRFNLISLLSFILGLVFLGIFFFFNYPPKDVQQTNNQPTVNPSTSSLVIPLSVKLNVQTDTQFQKQSQQTDEGKKP